VNATDEYLTSSDRCAISIRATVRGSWIAPTAIVLAVSQVLRLRFRLQAQRTDASRVGYLGLVYLGTAYFLAVIVATPQDWRFWLVFGIEVSIVGPVVLLFARHVLPARIRDERR
jgi:hypothetical protein